MSEEYIRRQDAIDAFNRIKNTLKNPETAHYDTLMFYEIEDVLEDVEPADVAPVVHGKWIKQYRGQVNSICSVCGKEVGRITNFCSRCGTKMDG